MSKPQSGQSSRLNKLLALLETGSTDSTKQAAARQISEIARAHPEQLLTTVQKIHSYLYHRSWETRVAAGEAISYLADIFKHTTAQDLLSVADTVGSVPLATEPLNLSLFSLQQVLDRGTPLGASGGQEFDLVVDPNLPPKARLAAQKDGLKKRLGLDKDIGLNADDLFGDEDFEAAEEVCSSARLYSGTAQQQVRQPAQELMLNMDGLSARERNRLKRKAKAMNRNDSMRSTEALPRHKSPLEGDSSQAGSSCGRVDSAAANAAAAECGEDELQQVMDGGWPFQKLADQLVIDVLDPAWEVRHGAALALRELMRTHDTAAGVEAPLDSTPSGWAVAGGQGKRRLGDITLQHMAAAQDANRRWLQDLITHLLCVLALDRFADYGSDQVTAPVRETAAQALGLALQRLDLASVQAVASVLKELQMQQDWRVRYGGLCGVKYLLAARLDLGPELLPAVLPALRRGLDDPDDDVRAASADALVPVAHTLPSLGPDLVAGLRQQLWGLLPQLTDHSAATASVMSLLAALYDGAQLGPVDELTLFVPRLWPFFRHMQSGVRASSLACIERILSSAVSGAAAAQQAAHAAAGWLQPLLAPLLQLLLQNLLVEGEARVLDATARVWRLVLACAEPTALQQAMSPDLMRGMMTLCSTPLLRPLDNQLLMVPNVHQPGELIPRTQLNKLSGSAQQQEHEPAVGRSPKRPRTGDSSSSVAVSNAAPVMEDIVVGKTAGGEDVAARMRVMTADALGALLCSLHAAGSDEAATQVHTCLTSASATARQFGGLVTCSWLQEARRQQRPQQLPERCLAALREALLATNCSSPFVSSPGEVYAEAVPFYSQMRREVLALITAVRSASGDQVLLPLPVAIGDVRPEHVPDLLRAAANAEAGMPPVGVQAVAAACERLDNARAALQGMEQYLHITAVAAIAAALVHSGQLPDKYNAVIQPLMNSLRREPQLKLQEVCAAALAELLALCVGRSPSPNDKLLRNIIGMATTEAPAAPASGRGASANGNDQAVQATLISRRGGECALVAMARRCGPQLFEVLPTLWTLVSGPLTAAAAAGPAALDDPAVASNMAAALHVLRVIGPELAPSLVPSLVSLLGPVCGCATCGHARMRDLAVRCAATLARSWAEGLMPELLKQLVPMLGHADVSVRLGGVQLVSALCSELGPLLVPYVVLLLVPLLRRMSDPMEDVRRSASNCFGTLVALLPLAQGVATPSGLDSDQLAVVQQDSAFLLQLLDNKQLEAYQLPFSLPVQLRPYQQDGINWLGFLRRFGLHGVLADDMGLGKTLQASCIMAAASLEQEAAYAADRKPELRPLPCLVVCPATLVAHWAHEVNSLVGAQGLRPLQYAGTPSVRVALQQQFGRSLELADGATQLPHNLLIMSYESLRADADWVASHTWLYCVLDEGHTIRNPRSRITQACKRVVAHHRLLLSGTPIQNDVLEMWSLFDFLMPGFLGQEKAFSAKFGKALQEARTNKRGSQEAEAGLLALDGLHRSLLPFVLRRTKGQVLSDLPPKIITDIYCDMGPLQARLYHDFQTSQASAEAVDALKGGGGAALEDSSSAATPHVFQALQYMRRLCSHPLLVLDLKVPEHQKAVQSVLHTSDPSSAEAALHQLVHAPKLAALRDILASCGIIAAPDADDGGSPGSPALSAGDAVASSGPSRGSRTAGAASSSVEAGGADLVDAGGGGNSSGHRVLVFAQLKAMLDLVERDVLQANGVSFLRLDGGVDASARFGIVQRFNSDPTIDVLLLTTGVGGVGLNLTSADTVVFLEHDWNPMKDLQAMDRAHRLGQRRTVNVYRILMRSTLEERVMGLQQFKLDVAAAVVNADNISLNNMDTSSLLDVFGAAQPGGGASGGAAKTSTAGMLPSEAEAIEAAAAAAGDDGKAGGRAKSGLAAMLSEMGDMWDEQQYASQFSMDAFMRKVGRS